jgi:DNA modification methylase
MELLLPFAETNTAILWGDTLEYPSTRTLKLYTHRIFNRYPARSISLVPRQLLQAYRKEYGSGVVLDPFMGSGTTAIEGLLAGFSVMGVEIDPFARLVSEVSTTLFCRDELRTIREIYTTILAKFDSNEESVSSLPPLQNIAYWFTEQNLNDLLKLNSAIQSSCQANSGILNFFRLVLTDIIRPCSKAERQTLKPYISKKYIKTPAPVRETFQKSFENYLVAIREFSEVVQHTDTTFEWVGENAVDFSTTLRADIAITSPPYLNALDYTRCIKIESSWAGCADDSIIRSVKNNQVGDESRKAGSNLNDDLLNLINEYVTQIGETDPRRASITIQYFDDMRRNLSCVYDTLRNGGEYHLIVGNSVIRGIDVPTHEILAKIGEQLGFSWSGYFNYRIKDHRLSIPRNNNGGKIDIEHVITLRKLG